MSKVELKKPTLVKNKKMWTCKWLGISRNSLTPSGAYNSLFKALREQIKSLSDTCEQLIKERKKETVFANKTLLELQKAKADLAKFSGFEPRSDVWVAERINFYNQACIDLIWKEKRVPTIEEYKILTGRTSRREEIKHVK